MSNEYNTVLVINVLAARSLRAADLNGRSDPYAKIKLISQVGGSFGQPDGGHEWKTKAHKHTLDPQWRETATLLARRTIETIPVFDEDMGSGADSLGKVDIPINKAAPYTLQDGWYTINAKHNSEVHVSYIYIPLDGVTSIAENAQALKAQLQAAMADDASDDAKIANLSSQLGQVMTEKSQLEAYTNGLLAQIQGLESHKAALEAQLTQAKAAGADRLTITRALVYVVGNNSVAADKTHAVRAHATPAGLSMPMTNEALQGDAFVGQPKELRVYFTRNPSGPEECTVVGEGGHVSISL